MTIVSPPAYFANWSAGLAGNTIMKDQVKLALCFY
jgi:hypothetical protein